MKVVKKDKVYKPKIVRSKLNRFKDILSFQAKSLDFEGQEEIAKHVINVARKLSKDPIKVQRDNGKYKNYYFTKGDGIDDGSGNKVYPTIVAHLDQVHNSVRNGSYTIHEQNDFLFATAIVDGVPKQVGTGSDDLTGVWVVLEMLISQPNVKACLFFDEENGINGSEHSDTNWFKDSSLILQADRRHSTNDFIDYTNGVQVQSPEFKTAVQPLLDEFGYKFSNGSGTDVGQLVKNGVGVCTANVACGYHKAHTAAEYSVISQSFLCLEFMSKLFKSLGNKRWELEEEVWKPKPVVRNNNYANNYGGVNGNYYNQNRMSQRRVNKLFDHDSVLEGRLDNFDAEEAIQLGDKRNVFFVQVGHIFVWLHISGKKIWNVSSKTWKVLTTPLPSKELWSILDSFYTDSYQKLELPLQPRKKIKSYLDNYEAGFYKCPHCLSNTVKKTAYSFYCTTSVDSCTFYAKTGIEYQDKWNKLAGLSGKVDKERKTMGQINQSKMKAELDDVFDGDQSSMFLALGSMFPAMPFGKDGLEGTEDWDSEDNLSGMLIAHHVFNDGHLN